MVRESMAAEMPGSSSVEVDANTSKQEKKIKRKTIKSGTTDNIKKAKKVSISEREKDDKKMEYARFSNKGTEVKSKYISSSSDDEVLALHSRSFWGGSPVDIRKLRIPKLSELFPFSDIENDGLSEQSNSVASSGKSSAGRSKECDNESCDQALVGPNEETFSDLADPISSGEEYDPNKDKSRNDSVSTDMQEPDSIEECFIKANQKRKQKLEAGDKNWKKKATNLKRRKRAQVICRVPSTSGSGDDCSGSENASSNKRSFGFEAVRKRNLTKRKLEVQAQIPTTSESDGGSVKGDATIEAVRKKSLKEHRLHRLVLSIHTKRLDALLASNGLQRMSVPASGNCFFEAISALIGGQKDVDTVRKDVCDHLESEMDHYRPFMALCDEEDDEQMLTARYMSEVEDLRKEGHWSCRLADALPMAVSNIYQARIMIYTSKPTQPVMEVVPSMLQVEVNENFALAYVALKGQEHYDPCEKVSKNAGSKKSLEGTPRKRKPKKQDGPITPRKQGKYHSPPKKKLSRKKKANPDTWKQNVRRTLRQRGKAYISVKGVQVPERAIGKSNCAKCRYKCCEKVPEERRKMLFKSYWDLASHDRQRDYICNHVLERESKGEQKRRKFVRTFSFTLDGERVVVCKNFFITTLGIGRKTIECVLRRKSMGSTPSDKRGRRPPPNKTPDADVEAVRGHIESFPKTESHYTRKDSKREYLSSDLSINTMYLLYKEEQQKKGRRVVKSRIYRNIFCNDYNLSFHKPKKDQRSVCNNFNQRKAAGTLDEKTSTEYQKHQNRKVKSRQEKEADKQKSKADNTLHVATFDMQAVLSTPCSLVSLAYYKRKLSCYNLSVYSLKDGQATCFLWNETEGQRGSCGGHLFSTLFKISSTDCETSVFFLRYLFWSEQE